MIPLHLQFFFGIFTQGFSQERERAAFLLLPGNLTPSRQSSQPALGTSEVCLRMCECVCVCGHGYVCVCARARLRACAPCRGAREGRELLCRCGPAPAASGCSLGERLDVLASGFRGLLLLWGRGETAGLLPSPLMGALPAPRDLPAGPPQAASAHCPDMLPAGVD